MGALCLSWKLNGYRKSWRNMISIYIRNIGEALYYNIYEYKYSYK